jgi:hypothetical protein
MAKKIKEFLVTITFNNQTHTFETNSVEESILSVKPFHLKTKIIVKIEKNGQAVEKFLPGTKGKLLFMNPSYLAAFVRGFFFK